MIGRIGKESVIYRPCVAFCHPRYLFRTQNAANISLTGLSREGVLPKSCLLYSPLLDQYDPRRMGVLGCRRAEVAQFCFRAVLNGCGLDRTIGVAMLSMATVVENYIGRLQFQIINLVLAEQSTFQVDICNMRCHSVVCPAIAITLNLQVIMLHK